MGRGINQGYQAIQIQIKGRICSGIECFVCWVQMQIEIYRWNRVDRGIEVICQWQPIIYIQAKFIRKSFVLSPV